MSAILSVLSPRTSHDQGFRVLRFWNNEVLNAGGGRDWIVAANR
jgi:very-short-patch-repair endonuclease